ncbi:MAG: PadR family transcriptional regulator [Imperialibacter sp.]|uniref:PadR family transcriptional regulator n=1 Tax=Imperialibacter sp. TaxID=2038411 RepID=UPI003A857C8F
MKGTHLGEFEELILLTVALLNEEAYGVAIQKEIRKKAGRSVAISAIHSALNRLDSKGFVESAFGEATPERGGKRKRIFKVTAFGIKSLEQAKELRESYWTEIPQLSMEGM